MNTIDTAPARFAVKVKGRLTNATIAITMGVAAVTSSSAALAQQNSAPAVANIRYRTVAVDGINIFYRKAGDPAKPTPARRACRPSLRPSREGRKREAVEPSFRSSQVDAQ